MTATRGPGPAVNGRRRAVGGSESGAAASPAWPPPPQSGPAHATSLSLTPPAAGHGPHRGWPGQSEPRAFAFQPIKSPCASGLRVSTAAGWHELPLAANQRQQRSLSRSSSRPLPVPLNHSIPWRLLTLRPGAAYAVSAPTRLKNPLSPAAANVWLPSFRVWP